MHTRRTQMNTCNALMIEMAGQITHHAAKRTSMGKHMETHKPKIKWSVWLCNINIIWPDIWRSTNKQVKGIFANLKFKDLLMFVYESSVVQYCSCLCLFDFSCMATIEVGIMYDQTVKGKYYKGLKRR